MYFVFFVVVGLVVLLDYVENSVELWDCCQQVNYDVVVVGVEVLQDLWCLDINGVEGIGQVEVGEGIYQYCWCQYFVQCGMW